MSAIYGGPWTASQWSLAIKAVATVAVDACAADGDLSLIHISEPTRRTPISYAVFCLKKKKASTKNSAFTKFKYVAEGRYIRDENLSHSCQGRVYSSTLGARCVYRGERQRHYGGWGVLNAVARSSYFVTVGQLHRQ